MDIECHRYLDLKVAVATLIYHFSHHCGTGIVLNCEPDLNFHVPCCGFKILIIVFLLTRKAMCCCLQHKS